MHPSMFTCLFYLFLCGLWARSLIFQFLSPQLSSLWLQPCQGPKN